MPYLGSKPVNNFVSFAKQDITGNGGTSYSLDYPVTGPNDIEVFINNVRQEPVEAYTTAGQTLTLAGAVTASDDVYVIFRGRALQTVTPPDASVDVAKLNTASVDGRYVNKSGDTMTGALGIGGTPSYGLHVQNAVDAQAAGQFERTGGAIMRIQPEGFDAKFGTYSNTPLTLMTNSTSRMAIDASGRVTMPYQPAFFAYRSGSGNNSSDQDLSCDVATINVGGHYNTSNFRFTAPIAGRYQFFIHAMNSQGNTGPSVVFVIINGVAYHYFHIVNSHPSSATTALILDLQAGDYVNCSSNHTHWNGGSQNKYPYFSGYLIG